MTSDSDKFGRSPGSLAGRGLMRSGAWTAALTAAIGALGALGLWVSFHYARVAWGPDGDTFVTIALWRGFQEHGLRFFSSWAYSQDNWLFSLIPIASAVFAVFGPTPEAAMALGWGGFIASVALAVWITALTAGRRPAMLLGCVLLFASFPALGPVGFLAYPISHNVSMAWGLAAIAIAMHGLARRSLGACVAAALAVFLNTVSDPWAGAAVALPIVFAGAAIAATRAEERRCARMLALASFIAFVCARTRLFGALWFLPASHFELTDLAGLQANLHWGALALAKMFNIVPAGRPAEQLGVCVFNLLALAVIVGGASLSATLNWRTARLPVQFVAVAAISSIAAVSVLYLAGRWGADWAVGRFFPNLYFFGAILIASQAAFRWHAWPVWARAGIGLYAGLFVLSGAVKHPDLWLNPPSAPPAPKAAAARALGDYLAAHGLAYGYGPFWGVQALAMDTLTGGRVTVRPVSFRDGHIRRRQAETSSLWFRPEAEPSNSRIFLVIMNDGEECPDPRACEALAVQQFGPPAERLQHDDAAILVWNQPLAPKIGQ